MTNCPITSRSGHAGAYICESQPLYVTWYLKDDPGSGWRWPQGGVAGGPEPAGPFIVDNSTIAVIGTDNFGYCNTTTAPGVWTGWARSA